MTEEEEKAIENLNRDKNNPLYCGDITIVNIDDLDTALNLIQKQQAEIIEQKKINRQLTLEKLKQEMIIDEMAKRINDETLGDIICDEIENKEPCEVRPAECIDCIKQYFENKIAQ